MSLSGVKALWDTLRKTQTPFSWREKQGNLVLQNNKLNDWSHDLNAVINCNSNFKCCDQFPL